MTLNVDLAPTFAEWAGASIPTGTTKVDGISLASLIAGNSAGTPRERVLTECWGQTNDPDIHASIRTMQWKYVEHYADNEMKHLRLRPSGRSDVELYDLAKDPYETKNLALLPDDAIMSLGYTRAQLDGVMFDLGPKLVAAKAE